MPAESNEVPKEATPEVKPEVVAARPLVFLDIEVIISNLHEKPATFPTGILKEFCCLF